ncbi:MAG: hypothetical protein WCT08_04120 [Patescibacteria group bacterium]|jgi:hypothetical protein
MIIWLAMLIPVLVAIFLLIFYRRKMLWWEFFIPLFFSFLLVVIFKLTISKVQTTDIEYWGGYVTQVQYFEAWDEWVVQICTRTYACGQDSYGNTEWCTETYDCSHSVNHSEEWHAIESNGFDIEISEAEYNRLVKQFGIKPKFIDLNRDYYTEDGDLYQVDWDNTKPERFEPVTTEKFYENRVQAAHSIFSFPDVSDSIKAQYNLIDYPKTTNPFHVPGILGAKVPGMQKAERQLDYLNATLGAPKKIRIWILLFRNQPLDAGQYQEWYWKGGNKNEFILAIGLDNSNAIQWVHPISWTPVERLKVDAQYFIDSMKTQELDLTAVVYWLGKNIQASWVKKDFREFNYLTIDPPGWAIAVTFIVTLLVNIAISFWLVLNEYNEEEQKMTSRYRYSSPY